MYLAMLCNSILPSRITANLPVINEQTRSLPLNFPTLKHYSEIMVSLKGIYCTNHNLKLLGALSKIIALELDTMLHHGYMEYSSRKIIEYRVFIDINSPNVRQDLLIHGFRDKGKHRITPKVRTVIALNTVSQFG